MGDEEQLAGIASDASAMLIAPFRTHAMYDQLNDTCITAVPTSSSSPVARLTFLLKVALGASSSSKKVATKIIFEATCRT